MPDLEKNSLTISIASEFLLFNISEVICLVKSSNIYAVIESDIKKECEKAFNCSVKYFSSSITGKDGNKEFFVYGKKCE